MKKTWFFFIAANTLGMLALTSVAGPAAAQSAGEPLMLGPIQVLRDEPSYLDFAAGAFNITERRDTSLSAEAKLEFRYGKKLWIFGPAVGVLANSQGGALVYGGFYSDLKYNRFVVTPLAAVGGYHRGGSEDLGGVLEFRLSLGIAYEFDDSSRLGLQIGHISNANIHEKNPSENELLLSYAIPIRW
jgi:hypothetical protein